MRFVRAVYRQRDVVSDLGPLGWVDLYKVENPLLIRDKAA